MTITTTEQSHVYLNGMDLACDLERAITDRQEILDAVEGEPTPEQQEELEAINLHLANLASDQEAFLIGCHDYMESVKAEADRLKEKAARIKDQANAAKRKAEWVKSFMTWYLQQYAPNGVRTDEGKFHLRTSKSVSVHASTQQDYDYMAHEFEQVLSAILADQLNIFDLIDNDLVDPDLVERCQYLLDPNSTRVKVVVEPDKTNLTRCLKSGLKLDGFSLVENKTVSLSRPQSKEDQSS